jgi:SAM-dependent methyltransferase
MQDRTDALIDPLGRVAMERLGVAAGERDSRRGVRVRPDAAPAGRARRTVRARARRRHLAADARAARGSAPPDSPSSRSRWEIAQTYGFAPGAFDALYSRFGVMFFDDPGAAFRNLRAAARSSGRLSFVCWQDLAKNPWASRPLEAVMRLLPESALPDMLREGRPGPFFMSDPARVRAILGAGGWKDVSFEPVEMPLHLGGAATLDEAVEYSLQIGAAARAMTDAPEALKPALEAAIREALAPFASARGVFMDGAAFVVGARA